MYRGVVASISRKALRVDVDRGADILWTVQHPDVFLLLVAERGWTLEQYEAWAADLSCEQLLKR